MATMVPADLDSLEKATAVEKIVFRFLKEAALPQEDYICWYKPAFTSPAKKPDFILLGKKLGVLILEVRDWTCPQIIAYTPAEFTIRIAGKPEKQINPDKRTKGYINILMEKLREVSDFLNAGPDQKGALKIPVGRMVVVPNIQRDDYHKKGLQWIIPDERALFKDDLAAQGPILRDRTGHKFFERIAGALPFRLKGLTQGEVEKLSLVISPDTKIDLPVRDGAGMERFKREVRALDEVQARLALRLGPGHQMIKGPPGAGKTIALVHRCCHLYRFRPDMKKILLLCYNIALVGYLKGLLREKGLETSKSGIHVCHFFELCAQVLEKPVRYENENANYYDLVVQETLARVRQVGSPGGPFDAILIDEGQDFDDNMLKIPLFLLRPGGDLLISMDSYQDLYRRRSSWKSLGIKASGRTFYLKRVYRNTREILGFSQRFIGDLPQPDRQMALLPFDPALQGGPPELYRFKKNEEIEDFLIKDLHDSIDKKGYRKSEIAIIYDDKVYGAEVFAYDNRALPMRILQRLESSGIATSWVSRDVRAKETFDITADRVSLLSIHSSKGLDFDLVYLMGIDHFHPTETMRKHLIALVYVAITRAKYRLVIPYIEETELIHRMKKALKGYIPFPGLSSSNP